MESQTVRQIEKAFRNLLNQRGFIETARHDAESFDDGFAVYEAADVRLRLVSDRGTASVHVGSVTPGSECFDLGLLKNLVIGGNLLEMAKPSELAIFLEQHFDTVVRLFGKGERSKTEASLRVLEQQRVRKMFPTAFSKS